MAIEEKIIMQQIKTMSKPVPDGFGTVKGISVEWQGHVVLDVDNTTYAGVTLRKGDKSVTLTWSEIATRLGLDW